MSFDKNTILFLLARVLVGAKGFEPSTFCSQIYEDGIPAGVKESQPSEMITETDPNGIQLSQGFAAKTKDLVTRLLPDPYRSKGEGPGGPGELLRPSPARLATLEACAS